MNKYKLLDMDPFEKRIYEFTNGINMPAKWTNKRWPKKNGASNLVEHLARLFASNWNFGGWKYWQGAKYH